MNFLTNIDSDTLFSTGIVGLIRDAIQECNITAATLSSDFSEENIHAADFIFMSVCAGEYYLCLNELINKKKSAKLFIFVTSDNLPPTHNLPDCINGAQFFTSKADPTKVYTAIVSAISAFDQVKENDRSTSNATCSCLNCNYKTLSITQEKIVCGLNTYMTMNDIAEQIGITYKTAISHRKNIMSKFNLNSKLELFEFIACYHKKKY